jgi:hypothetical protein
MSMTDTATRQRPQRREARKPDFIVRCPDPHRPGRWVSLGAAWKRDDGGLNIKLATLPVGNGWDGALVCLPPIENEDPPQD